MPRSGEAEPTVELPYPPGWLDRLIDWIGRMPGSNVLYCLGLLVLQFGYLTALLWANGTLAVGSVDLKLAFVVVVAPYLLWVRFSLDRVAAAALDTFRPALTVGDADLRRLRFELTNLPARQTLIVTVVAVAVFFLNAVLSPNGIAQQYGPTLGAAVIAIGPVGLFTVAVVAVSTFQAVHQLRMVERIHGLVGRVDLLRAKPLYAFSRLAALTGASFLLLTYYVGAVRPDLVSTSRALEALLVAMVPIATACFVLPLRGMHRRLADEKDRALAQVASRFEVVFERLHERVDREVLADADKLKQQIDSLSAEHAVLEKVSTWPWEPQVLTGFVTTLLLPVLLWGVQRVLERVGF